MRRFICWLTRKHAPVTVIRGWVYCSRCYDPINFSKKSQAA